jgi:hypothetical protein
MGVAVNTVDEYRITGDDGKSPVVTDDLDWALAKAAEWSEGGALYEVARIRADPLAAFRNGVQA